MKKEFLVKAVLVFDDSKEARQDIRQYINAYNFERIYSSIGALVTTEAYYPALLIEETKKVA